MLYGEKTIVEPYGDRYIVQNPPQHPLTEKDMDKFITSIYKNISSNL